MANFVVSYDREDSDFVDQLAGVLAKENHEVWYDRNIAYGQRYSKVIKQEIDRCDEVIVLWSHASVESNWVESEATYALAQQKIRPACIRGLSLTELPLAFYSLNTFVFEKEDPAYLKRAVRAFLTAGGVGRGRGTPGSQSRASATAGEVTSRRWAAWATVSVVASAMGVGAFAGNNYGPSQANADSMADRLAKAEEQFLTQFQFAESAFADDPGVLAWARKLHEQMFPESDRLKKQLENFASIKAEMTNAERVLGDLGDKDKAALPEDDQ